MSRPLLVLGLSTTGLAVVREMGRRGVSVWGYDPRRFMVASASRYCQRVPLPHGLDPKRDLAEALLSWMQQQPRLVVVPTSDVMVEFVATHAERLAAHADMAPCYRDGVALALMDKRRLDALAERAGVARPRTWSLEHGDGPGAPADAAYPLLIKPRAPHRDRARMGHRKAVLVADEAALAALGRKVDLRACLAQELIDGPEHEIVVVAAHRRASGDCTLFSARKLRQQPRRFGSASLVRTESIEAARDQTACLLRDVGFVGVCGVEWKWDRGRQTHVLIEVNPRPCLWYGVSDAAGYPLVAAHHAALMGAAAPPCAPREGAVQWRDAARDGLARIMGWRRAVCLPPSPQPVVQRVGAVAARDDWRPLGQHLVYGVSRVLSRIARASGLDANT